MELLDEELLRDDESSELERRLLDDESSEPERLLPDDELLEPLELPEELPLPPDDLPDEPDEPLPEEPLPEEPLPEEPPPFLASTIGMLALATSATSARQDAVANGVFIAPAGMLKVDKTAAHTMPRRQEFLMFMEFSQLRGNYFPQTKHSGFLWGRKSRGLFKK